jgi:dTDP-glucose pyrophosphorylase
VRTTIQISEELRKQLKILASYSDVSYEEALRDFIEMFKSMVPFMNEWEFADWFEKNLERFGFRKIIERKKGFPDYKIEDIYGKIKRVELELIGADFTRHRHDPKKVDMIVCVYSDKDEIDGVPTLSIIEVPRKPDEIIGRRQRLSVSLDPGIVKQITREAEEVGVKSLSGFLEGLILEHLEGRETCVILAGGDPKKLFIKELNVYRPLVEINGRKLIEDIVIKCRNAGFHNIIVVGHNEIIERLFGILGYGEKYDARIMFLKESVVLGSAKTLELAKKYIKTDFLFLPCDHWFDFDLKKLREFHFEQNGTATLAIHNRTNFDWKTSVVDLEGPKIVNYDEFPKTPKTHLISTFIGFMKKSVFNFIPTGKVNYSLQENLFPKLAKEDKLIGYLIPGNWVNVHSKQDVEKIINIRKQK